MILHYDRLREQVIAFQKAVGLQSGRIQKIYSTPHLICLIVRYPGISRYLYLGRGGGYEGFWQAGHQPPAPFRIIDRFLEYLRKYLENRLLEMIEVDVKDRILFLKYSHGTFGFFYKGRDLYFAHYWLNQHETKLFLSWRKVDSNEQIPDYNDVNSCGVLDKVFDELGRGSLAQNIVIKDQAVDCFISSYFLQLSKSSACQSSVPNKVLLKKIKKIEEDLAKVQHWRAWQIELKRQGLSLDGEQIEFKGLVVKFASEMSYFERIDTVYKKLKRWREVEDLLRNRLVDCQQQIKEKSCRAKESKYSPKILAPIWKSEKVKNIEVAFDCADIKEYRLASGVKIACGMNAEGNDYLRCQWADREDYWFHLDGYPSGHCIVKMAGQKELDILLLPLIASILRDGVGAMMIDIPIQFTRVKNIKGIKGKRGAVIVKKAKHLSVRYFPDWVKSIEKD